MAVVPKTAGLLAVLVLSLFPSALRADDRQAALAEAVARAVRPLLQEHGAPGVAVAVTVDGRRRFFSYGVASKERNTPVTQDTLFEIGSVSKAFTATLVAYAQALGKISLDDRPGEHMPQLRGAAVDRSSLLDLGAYTAGGLPLQFPDAVTDDAAMETFFRRWTPPAALGAVRRYSNPSIGLLGHIAAIAMGRDFAELVETELFPRLGLRRSFIRVPDDAIASYAWGYSKAGKPIRVNPGVFDAQAYGVKSTAADMIRFVEANIAPETLEPPMRRAVEGTQIGYFRVGEMVQGLGWEQYPYPVALERLLAGNSGDMATAARPATRLTPPQAPSASTLFNKTGSTNGFGAYVAFVPKEKIGVVLLANRNVPIPARIKAAHAVLNELSAKTP